MGAWIDGPQYMPDNQMLLYPNKLEVLQELDMKPTCGTTMCIAGYAQSFVDGAITSNVADHGAELLGLPENTSLFYAANAPARLVLEKLAAGETVTEDQIWDIRAEYADGY